MSLEEKVRTDFGSSLNVLSVNLRDADCNALPFILGILARNFSTIQNKPSRQFFDLFTRLIDMKAYRDELMGATEDSSSIYDPEDLLNQIIDKIKAQQKMKMEQAADANEDEVEA